MRVFGTTGLWMGLPLGLCIRGRILRSVRCYVRVAISSVTVGAAEANRAGDMHGGAVGRGVAGQAAGGLAVGVGLRLQEQYAVVALRMNRTCGAGTDQTE